MGPFINTLKQERHIVSYTFDRSCPSNVDIWFIDYHKRLWWEDIVKQNNLLKDIISNFKGKIVLYSLDDNGWYPVQGLHADILHRINALMVFIKSDYDKCKSPILNSKIITIPRYLCNHREFNNKIIKIPQIFFIGNLTGGYKMGGKNWRVEAMKLIQNSLIIKNKFIGGIVGKEIIDVKQNEEYNKTFFDLIVPPISEIENIRRLEESLITLCIPGNTIWSYRFPLAMQLKTTIITMEGLKKDPGEWMYNNVFSDEFYYVKPDLSNFIEICKYALENIEETKDKAERAYQLYNKYFRLESGGFYMPHVWKEVKDKFERLGVNL